MDHMGIYRVASMYIHHNYIHKYTLLIIVEFGTSKTGAPFGESLRKSAQHPK